METDFNLIETVRDAAKYGDKLDNLIKAKKDAESAKQLAEIAGRDLEKKKLETDNYVNGKKAELSAKQLEHDKAAKEAADRIEAGRGQMAEVERVRAELNAKQSELDGKERDLDRREKALSEAIASIETTRRDTVKAADLVRRQQAHIAAMPKA